MRNASQKRTNRAPLSLELQSSTPAMQWGWLAMMPTVSPPSFASPITMDLAKSGCSSMKLPTSNMLAMTPPMS